MYNNKSVDFVKNFTSSNLSKRIEMSASTVDAVVGFFESKGFEIDSAASLSSVLLEQAKAENINVFSLIDSLKKYNKVQLSKVVAVILNSKQEKSSLLGFKTESKDKLEQRNIII